MGQASKEDLAAFCRWASIPGFEKPRDPLGLLLTQARLAKGEFKIVDKKWVCHETAESFLSRTPVADLAKRVEDRFHQENRPVADEKTVEKAIRDMGARRRPGRPSKPKT